MPKYANTDDINGKYSNEKKKTTTTLLNITSAYALKNWNVRHQRRYLMHKQKPKTLAISQIGASSLNMWRAVSLLFLIVVSDYYRLIKSTSATSFNLHTGIKI